MFEVIACSLENRSFFRSFQERLYSKLNCFSKLRKENIGKNFSFLVIKKLGDNHLILFDVDDGSGITDCRPGHLDGDCKLNFEKLQQIKSEYEIKNILVFKLQFNPDDCEFYPFKDNVFPAGYYCDDQDSISPVEITNKDIDVIWIGSVNLNGSPWNWPNDKDIKQWPSGRRRAGYHALKEIKERRKDLNIICTPEKFSQEEYNGLINRSKICVELPGCGWFTRRLVENIRRGKCILSLEQKQKLHFDYVSNLHYCLIENDEFLDLEEKIDMLLSTPHMIAGYENQSKNISRFFDYQYMIDNIISSINEKT